MLLWMTLYSDTIPDGTVNIFLQAFLIYPITRFGKTNEPRMIYASETGIRTFFNGFGDIGRIFENDLFLRLKTWQPENICQDGTEIDFRLNNELVIESKFNEEQPLDKQQKLYSSFDESWRHITGITKMSGI